MSASNSGLDCFRGKPIVHPITGENGPIEIGFRPVTGRRLFELRGLVGPVAVAIAAFFPDSKNDISVETVQTVADGTILNERTGKMDPLFNSKTVANAIDPSLAKHRDQQRASAIESIISTIFDDKNKKIIHEMILESARDFFKLQPIPPTAEVLANELELPVFIEFCIGVLKANQGVLGPLGGMMKGRMDEVIAKIGLATAQASPEKVATSETAAPPSPTPQPSIRLAGQGG